MSDIVEIKRLLAARAQSTAEHLLPAGKRVGAEWRAGSIAGDAGKSLGVHLSGEKAGLWADFGSDEKGELIDLWMATRRLALLPALDEIRAWLGIARPAPYSTPRQDWKRPARPRCRPPEGRAMDYLVEDRNLPADVLRAYRIGEDERGAIVFPFLLPDGTLAMAKRRDSADGAKTVLTESGCEAVLFGWQAIPPNARTVVLTEGEIDALSWAAYGYPAMSLPFGGGGGAKQKWIESEYDRMARFERIYLATDMDEQGDKAADEIAGRLGLYRCLRVRMPRKDGNECLVDGVAKAEIDAAIAAAEWFEVAGLRAPTHYSDKVVGLLTGDGPAGFRLPYGALHGKLAFRPGELTIWTGDSGAGKTQILSDAIVDWVRQGSRVCLSSLEMHPAFTLRRMCRQVIGTDHPTEPATRAALARLQNGLLLYDHTGKQTIDEMLLLFDYGRARYGCDQFVIDSLMRLGVAGDDYNTQETVIFRIVEWAMRSAVHVHLVAHAKKGERDRGAPQTEDIKGAMEIGANAFNILAVWRDRKHEEQIAGLESSGNADEASAMRLQRPGVILNVAKQRNGDFEGKIGLWFDQKTYRYRSRADGPSWKREYLPEGWQREEAASAD
ncbi:toprim domain-containing protein [soil metagenome]